jgi:cardiolipin synthase
MAALGGVDVRVMVPLRSDARFVEWSSRSYLREVIDAGVRVSLYKDGFLHAKMMVCDDQICSCGSANVDFRSFENNFEANVFIYDEMTAAEMRDIYLEDEGHSVLFTDIPKRIHPRFLKRLGESLARMLSPLM